MSCARACAAPDARRAQLFFGVRCFGTAGRNPPRPEVLRAVERDLRREYGNRFRVLRANSGETALDALRQLKLRNDPVAFVALRLGIV